MKAIMVMFDSLNRHMLPNYGCDWTHAPNFKRLGERTLTFQNAWIGSMPCMPARRDLHTGRHNFLHRSWGPLEPFDDSMPEILGKSGVHTHLSTDHAHYFEDGGATYHSRYSTWEFNRGQEGDFWWGQVKDPGIPDHVLGRSGPYWRQDWINRAHMTREEDQPQAKTFAGGLEFMRTNCREDRWFLQIETFDPHEPFFSQQKYKDHYPSDYKGPHFDWPPYRRIEEPRDQVEHCRYEYAALLSMCDNYMGKVIDLMDELDLWKDTMLIVTTDHGFMLGEHDWWAKCRQPWYNELARIPFFVWDPRSGGKGESRESLVQLIDVPATLLEYFGVERPADMLGVPLRDAVARDVSPREVALFGQHGGQVNCTDGRFVYMRSAANPENEPLYNYTLMPTRMRGHMSVKELLTIELAEPFTFTKGLRTMRIKENPKWWGNIHESGSLLFDLQTDPGQEGPLQDPEIEERMAGHLARLLRDNDAPAEQYERLGLMALV